MGAGNSMTPEEKKAMEIIDEIQDYTTWCCEFESDHTKARKIIALALQQAYNKGLARGAEIAESVESVRHFKLGEPAHCIASTIRKEKR